VDSFNTQSIEKRKKKGNQMPEDHFAHAWLNDFFVLYDLNFLRIIASATFQNDGSVKIRIHDINSGEIRDEAADQLIDYFTEIAKEKERRKKQNKGDQ